MSVLEYWQQQKEPLLQALEGCATAADMAYQIRHALLQTEQNALAAMDDDILRQQAGILLSGLKNAAGLLDCHKQTQMWVPTSIKRQKRRIAPLQWFSFGLMAVLGVYCYGKGLWLALGLVVAALLLWVATLFPREAEKPQSDYQIVNKPDIDKLLPLLDGQVRAIDRALSDMAYLNDQLRGGGETADPVSLSRVADLMEALYEWDDDDRLPLSEPVNRLLESLGLCVLDYTPENRRYFNALPSKSVTRTLSPAILSVRDRQLLRRGTAAVRMDAV